MKSKNLLNGNTLSKAPIFLFIVFSLIGVGSSAQENDFSETTNSTDEATDVFEFEDLKITVQQNPVSTPIPTVSAQITQEQLRGINAANPEDAIKYMPNLFIRKRFIGDRNGVLSIRGSSVFQSARELVLVDGVTISNFLENRWNGAPKWQIVAPEEIVSTEIIYGPYSALYGGNSMNGVVNISTRQPTEQEVTLQTSYFLQDFEKYDTDDTFEGFKTFLSYGDKIGDLSFYGFYQHLENDSHPQDFARKFGGDITPSANPTDNNVIGVIGDRDPANRQRFIYGAVSFNETEQDLFKFKTAYEFSPDLRLQLTLGYWDSTDEDKHVESYLRDPNTGEILWSGDYIFNGQEFTVDGTDFRISERDRQDLLIGFTLEGKLYENWDFQSFVSWYDILKDEQHRTNLNPQDPEDTNPANSNAGGFRDQEFGNTYWLTYDLKLGNDDVWNDESMGIYTGFHYSKYNYEIEESETRPNNPFTPFRIRNDDSGNTNLYALFAQADYHFLDSWTWTMGVRQEWWQANDGKDTSLNFSTFRIDSFEYKDRSEGDFSPKISLSFEPNEEWFFRASMAKAVRYPVVTEIFIGNPDERSQVVSNPQLEPEESLSKTFIIERRIDRGSIQLAYFHNDEKNTIFNRNVQTATGTATSFVNIEEVETQGIELAIGKEALFVDNLDFNLSVAYNRTEIEELGVTLTDGSGNPIVGIEGNDLPRVPDWRLSMFTTYHVTDAWDISIGMRYADGSFDDLENSESNHDTYEGISSLFVWDFKTSYRFDFGLEVAFGIDNFTDDEYWMHHPFPQRSYYFDAKLTF